MHDNADYDQPRLLTVDEAAKLLRVGAGTVRQWRAAGLLRAVKYPGASNTRVVFTMAEIERFIAAYQEGSESCDSPSSRRASESEVTALLSAGGIEMVGSASRRLKLATTADQRSGSGQSECEKPIAEWLRELRP